MAGRHCFIAQPSVEFRTACPPVSAHGSSLLEWGCRFARNAIDELDARCGGGGAIARTQWGPFANGWTQLYIPYRYGQGVSLRAGSLIHEARHADDKGHNSANSIINGHFVTRTRGFNV